MRMILILDLLMLAGMGSSKYHTANLLRQLLMVWAGGSDGGQAQTESGALQHFVSCSDMIAQVDYNVLNAPQQRLLQQQQQLIDAATAHKKRGRKPKPKQRTSDEAPSEFIQALKKVGLQLSRIRREQVSNLSS